MPVLRKVDVKFIGDPTAYTQYYTEAEWEAFENSNTFPLYTIVTETEESVTIPPPSPVPPNVYYQYFPTVTGGQVDVTNFLLPDFVDHESFRAAFRVLTSGMEYQGIAATTSFEHYMIDKTGSLNRIKFHETNIRGWVLVMYDTRIEIDYS
jgi:hypothetical protein